MDPEDRLKWDFMKAKLKRYAEQVIKDFKEMGRKDGMQSSIDSGLSSLWDEWLVQVRGEHSIFYSVYEDMIRTNAEWLVKELPEDEVGLIWLASEAGAEYLDGLEEDVPAPKPSLSEMREGAAAALFDAVDGIARNQKLPENIEKYLEDGREEDF